MTVSFYQRRAGILLHPTSLPSGKLDVDAERWLETLASAGCSVWQVLPLGEPQQGLSPYQCVSAFAINPALYDAWTPINAESDTFRIFCGLHPWIDDYAMFKILHDKFDTDAWYTWPDEYRHRDKNALDRLRDEYSQQYLNLMWQQFELYTRWQQIKRDANSRGILLFGDMPLFVAYESADVWANPQEFLLNSDGKMKVVTGVPPDYFSDNGQRWGNPHYNWEVMRQEQFSWWQQRVNYHLDMFDLIRIDHFRGLQASWVIDASSETAIDGHWEQMPGDELLGFLSRQIGELPVVAEDLGIITKEVTALRKKYHLPGMSVLQFGFDEFSDNPHKPENIEADSVVYTGTHDNDTTRGWFEGLDPDVRAKVCSRLGINCESDAEDVSAQASRVVDKMIDNAMQSRASLCIIPLQDILHLDTASRMNIPGTTSGNWQWSFQWSQLDDAVIGKLRGRIEQSGRLVG